MFLFLKMEQSFIKDQLYNYRSFNRKEFQNVVDYLNIDHNMKELIVCGIKVHIF